MELWLWTLDHLQKAKLYQSARQGVTFPLADALCWLLATRCLILDVLELEEKGVASPVLAEGLEGMLNFYTDLCQVQCARSAGEVGRIAAELVFGYRSDGDGCDQFLSLRAKLDGSLTGAQLAKDRAAEALTNVMIPEALDYPA
jgi:hypothetical protein